MLYAIMGLQFFVNKSDEPQRLTQIHSFNGIGRSWRKVFIQLQIMMQLLF
ncbi:unnamed protein product [Paramecium sonneborni]|uniref:Uncharacterized protein n=1 Tax=Paramecium sonneborni TaxID=65129 RepID=A0A8S1RDD0_9CILI|nr:unnamed protein product [Paramecium sonneborni]